METETRLTCEEHEESHRTDNIDDTLDVDDKNNIKINTVLRQVIGSAGTSILPTCNGMTLGFSAILLPQLLEETSTIKLTQDEESWIASMAPLQMATGCLIGGWAMEKFGRKRVNLTGTILLIVGWTLIAFATSMELILAGRFVTGFSIGLSGPSCICYVGEIAEPKYRGIFLAGVTLGVALGLTLVHLLGTYLAWNTVALITTFMPITALITFAIAPESYVWLMKRERYKEAKDSFHWFRGYGDRAKQEIDVAMKHAESREIQTRTLSDLWSDCCQSRFIKPFLIINLFFIIVQLTGTNAISFYSVSIMQSTVPSLERYSAMLIIDVVRLVMSLVACFCTKKINVRPLAITSGIGTAVSLILLATFTFLNERDPDNRFYATVPMICLISYIVLLSIGLAPLPWLICGEILPPETKGIGSGISTSVTFLTMFAVVKTNPAMFQQFGVPGTYTVYGLLTLLGTAVLYFILPETRNKTLRDIEELFAKKN